MLVTIDAHGLYEQFGFKTVAQPERHMEILRQGMYENAASPAVIPSFLGIRLPLPALPQISGRFLWDGLQARFPGEEKEMLAQLLHGEIERFTEP